ncbi:unnamed protein product [Microthlaspi erraticum]|uniref:Uncharacterized protein n=1 Tax=Microthlaspi erraticum TaxID=1685480 RepID=A0A6D2J7N9_9BRAS|nr:unnamed protein product [Microthlaspi erraticum]
MERGKRVMQPEEDFDLNMMPEEYMNAKKARIFKLGDNVKELSKTQTVFNKEKEDECETVKKAKIFEIEAALDHMMLTSTRETYRNKELKKNLIEYIEENEMPVKVKELKKEKDQNLLWESIIIMKELVGMDPEATSSQSGISDNNNKNIE